MTDQPAAAAGTIRGGEVLEVDYDHDLIAVRFDDGSELTFAFELFDSHDVYQVGQRFQVIYDADGQPQDVAAVREGVTASTTLSGYVESVDPADELAWVYLRGEEGWLRKVMPLRLFEDQGLDRPGVHFLLDLAEDGTPLALRPDEQELVMLPLEAEQTKPRWTSRPASEAEPE